MGLLLPGCRYPSVSRSDEGEVIGMEARRPIGAVDTMWLNMDRAENLMVIDSVMWFDEPIDWDRLQDVIRRRLLNRYPVFRQRPVAPSLGLGMPHWEYDPKFDLRHHIHRRTLPPPGDQRALQRFLEKHMGRPLDREHPLWEVYLLDGYQGGSAVVMRFHHSLADGIALARVMLSLTDETATGDLEEAERGVGDRPDWEVEEEAAHEAEAAAGGDSSAGISLRDPLGLVSGVAAAAGAAAAATLHLFGGLPHLANPSTAVDAFTLAQQTGHIANKLLLGSKPRTTLSGPPGIQKVARWSQPRPLADVKFIGRVSGGTVNDVLVGAASGAISNYLDARGDDVADLTTMVPVNLRALDQPLPRELGNMFALVLLALPSGARSPMLRLAETKRRMDTIKDSPEAYLTFGLINAIGRTHPEIEKFLVNFFAAKAIGVTTNVAGPTAGRYLAGSRVDGVLGWVPGSGEQTLGICIFTYDGTVRVGFKADAASVPDADSLVTAFDQELDDLQRMAKAV